MERARFRVATADGWWWKSATPIFLRPHGRFRPTTEFDDALDFDETVRAGAFMRPLSQALENSVATFVVIQVA